MAAVHSISIDHAPDSVSISFDGLPHLTFQEAVEASWILATECGGEEYSAPVVMFFDTAHAAILARAVAAFNAAIEEANSLARAEQLENV